MFKNIITIFIFCWLLSGCGTVDSPNPVAANDDLHLAMYYLRHGDDLTAKHKLLLALHNDAHNPEILIAFAHVLDKERDAAAAERYYRRALAIAPMLGMAQNNYGVFLCQHGHYQAGRDYLFKAASNVAYEHKAAAHENASKCFEKGA